MLLDPEERVVVSSLGWVDGGAIRVVDVASARERSVRLGDARYLSLRPGRSGHFAVVHHYDADRLVVTAHAFSDPAEVLSRCVVSREGRGIEGPMEPWQHLPRHYVAYLVQPAWSAFALVSLSPSGSVGLQTFGWFDDAYDQVYQGIVGVTEIPGSTLLLVSVQRSSQVVLHDPEARCKVGEVALAGAHGNPSLTFCRSRTELWADDYDTLLKLEPGSWRVLGSRRLQEPAGGTSQFIGAFTFDPDESICAVARPFSGDVLGLDPEDLRTRYRCELGRQPLRVALLRDGRLFANDWKSGDLLRGRLSPVQGPLR